MARPVVPGRWTRCGGLTPTPTRSSRIRPRIRPTAPRPPARRPPAAESSPEHARMPERIAAGLRIDAEPVRTRADRDPRQQFAVRGADRVDLGVVAAGEPEDLAVGGDAAHVGAAARS